MRLGFNWQRGLNSDTLIEKWLSTFSVQEYVLCAHLYKGTLDVTWKTIPPKYHENKELRDKQKWPIWACLKWKYSAYTFMGWSKTKSFVFICLDKAATMLSDRNMSFDRPVTNNTLCLEESYIFVLPDTDLWQLTTDWQLTCHTTHTTQLKPWLYCF